MLAFLKLAWPYLLAAAAGGWLAWSLQAGRVAEANLELVKQDRDNITATAALNEVWRDKERQWTANGAAAEKQYAIDRATWDAARNHGPGASVRVCDPSTPAPRTAQGAGPLAGPVGSTPAAGLVPGAVPEGVEVGPMLRLVIAEGERVSDQLRAVLAERAGLSAAGG